MLHCGFQGGHTGPPLQAMMAKNTSTELQKNQKESPEAACCAPGLYGKKSRIDDVMKLRMT